MHQDLVELTGTVEEETTLAILFDDGDVQEWIPKSKIESQEEDEDGLTTIEIPEWMAVEKGFL